MGPRLLLGWYAARLADGVNPLTWRPFFGEQEHAQPVNEPILGDSLDGGDFFGRVGGLRARRPDWAQRGESE